MVNMCNSYNITHNYNTMYGVETLQARYATILQTGMAQHLTFQFSLITQLNDQA